MIRKLPLLNKDNATFWQQGAFNNLMIHHCANCQQYFHPPAPICFHCLSEDVMPKKVSGKGTVASFTINYQKWQPDLEVPYIVAIIELIDQKGLRFVSNIVEMNPSEVFIGMPVSVIFEEIDDIWLPLFKKEA